MLKTLRWLLQEVFGLLVGLLTAAFTLVDELVQTVLGLLHTAGQTTGYGDTLFLPPGKGASILIIGGIGMLAFSLAAALRVPQGQPTGSPSTSTTFRRHVGRASGRDERDELVEFSAVHAGKAPEPAWFQAVQRAASEAGFGSAALLQGSSGRRAVAIPGCHAPGRDGDGSNCNRAREVIQEAVGSELPNSRVATVRCNARNPRPCVFEILAEAPGQ